MTPPPTSTIISSPVATVPLTRVTIPPAMMKCAIVPGGRKAAGNTVVSAIAPARRGAGTASTAAAGVTISSASKNAAPGATVAMIAAAAGVKSTLAAVTPGTTGRSNGSITVGNAPVAGIMLKGTPPIVHLTALDWLTMPSIRRLMVRPSPAVVLSRIDSMTITPGASVRSATTLTTLPTTTGSSAVFTSAYIKWRSPPPTSTTNSRLPVPASVFMATMVAPGMTMCATEPVGSIPTNPLVGRTVESNTAPGKGGGTTSRAVGTAAGTISSASKTGTPGGGGGTAPQTNALVAIQVGPFTRD